MSPSRKLTAAREMLAEIEGKISELTAKREARLIAGDGAGAIGRLDDEIAKLHREAKTERDRAALLTKAAEREEREAIARRRAATIERVAKRLAEADALADELEQTITKADALLRAIIKKREDTMPVFALGDPHINASIGNPDGCALTPGAVVQLLKFELFRQGARIFAGGVPGARVEVSWPGGVCPRLEFQLQPERIMPLGTALRNASKFAIGLLRGEDVPQAPAIEASTPMQQQPAPTPSRLSQLLARQAELAADPKANDAEYMKIVADITTLTAGA